MTTEERRARGNLSKAIVEAALYTDARGATALDRWASILDDAKEQATLVTTLRELFEWSKLNLIDPPERREAVAALQRAVFAATPFFGLSVVRVGPRVELLKTQPR